MRELVDGECGQARRGQFERQRDAVEPAADLRNCTRIARIERESGHDGLRRFFQEWLEAFPDSSVEIEDVEVREPWTFAIVVQSVSGASSHTPVPFRYGGIGRWRDGRLEFVQNHSDLEAGRAVFEELAASPRAVDSHV